MELSPAVLAVYARVEYCREFEVLSISLVQMLYAKTIPPDDAYAWTRVLLMDARKLALITPWHERCDS